MNTARNLLNIAFLVLITVTINACATHGASHPAFDLSRDVIYSGPDHHNLLADLYVSRQPRGVGVIVIHGGGWIKGERENIEDYAVNLAENGYTVMNVSYRKAPEYHYPTQLGDVRAALEWLCRHADQYDIDRDRIAVLGYSAGAHLGLLLGLNPDSASTCRIAAVINGAGPVDLTAYPNSPLVRNLVGLSQQDNYQKRLQEASPLTYVSPDDPPVFVFHGERDWMVGIEQAEQLVDRLEQAGVSYEFHRMPYGHAMTFWQDSKIMPDILDFLNATMSRP